MRDDSEWSSVGKVNTEADAPNVIYATEESPLISIYGGVGA